MGAVQLRVMRKVEAVVISWHMRRTRMKPKTGCGGEAVGARKWKMLLLLSLID